MAKLRIVFMGTPEFAVATLRSLHENNYEVVGVITAPDRPAGRGRKLRMSAVKAYALEHGLPILQPTNLKDEAFLEELTNLKANLQIVVAFRMLPAAVWKLPKYGTFNLHASLLPQYRGAAPINWAIINGEKQTGVSTFFIDDKIDTGEIILQKKVKIKKEDTAGDLHDRLMQIGSKLVVKTVKKIENGRATTKKQSNNKASLAPKIFKETCRINWTQSGKKIFNHIRGLSPYPGAWAVLTNGEQQTEIKLLKVERIKDKHDHEIGSLIISKNTMLVAVKKGYIDIKELQLAGKRKMKIGDFLNGFSFKENAKLL